VEGVRLDLRELVLHVIWVHGANLLASWGAEHFDDLDKLINARLSREQGLTKHKFRHNTAGGPDIFLAHVSKQCSPHSRTLLTNLGGVVGGTKDELRSAIVAGADIRDIGLVCDQDFGATKVTELKNTCVWVKQKVLRLDITMTDSLGVDVR